MNNLNHMCSTIDKQREIPLNVVNGKPRSAKNCQVAPQQIAFALILFASAIGLLPHVDLRCRSSDRNTITGAYLCAANTSLSNNGSN